MKHHGFVLMTLILILSVVTLLVIADLRWLILDKKRLLAIQRFQEKNQQLDRLADKMALGLVYKLHRPCQLDQHLSDAEIKQYIASNACVIEQHYHYGITDLGIYPCIHLTTKNSTHHWLVSMMDEQLPHRLIQLRVVTPEEALCVKKQIIYVPAEILSRRWI